MAYPHDFETADVAQAQADALAVLRKALTPEAIAALGAVAWCQLGAESDAAGDALEAMQTLGVVDYNAGYSAGEKLALRYLGELAALPDFDPVADGLGSHQVIGGRAA